MENLGRAFADLTANDVVTIIAVIGFLSGLPLIALGGQKPSSARARIGGAAICVVGLAALIFAAIVE